MAEPQTTRGAHGPASPSWHAKRLFGVNVDLATLTPIQWEQAEQARLTWLRATSKKGTKVRQLQRAALLRERAAAIEASVADL